MSNTKFTPGNWFVLENSVGAIEVSTTSDDYLNIGIVSEDDNCTGGPTTKANAHLIASAPDLYEALEFVHKLICEGSEHGFNPLEGDWAERLFSSQGKRHQALIKATGEL